MVDVFGYIHFFTATAAIGIPVVALSLMVWRMRGSEAEEVWAVGRPPQ
jgi:hypothetical protein